MKQHSINCRKCNHKIDYTMRDVSQHHGRGGGYDDLIYVTCSKCGFYTTVAESFPSNEIYDDYLRYRGFKT